MLKLTDNAYKVFRERFSLKDDTGRPCEKPETAFRRVAHHVSTHGGRHTPEREEKFFSLMERLDFLPNSPTFTGAGTKLGQLAACFVLPIADDMGREEDGIFSILRKAVLIQQTGGGNGFSFSRIRPKDSIVSRSSGKATGPVGFIKAYDAAFGIVAQGGSRRGANMAILRVDHPDIEEFIECKSVEGSVTNFNISVAITDLFVSKVRSGGLFDLVDPHTHKVTKTIDARNLMRKIAEHAHKNGEPGLVFIDRMNDTNPVPHLYKIEATNPCGEQALGPYESCCLGSINLVNFVSKGKFNWDEFIDVINDSTDFLDCVVTANNYVEAVPELREAAIGSRRIGLGIMGYADACFMLGIPYGESVKFARAVSCILSLYSLRKSVFLAKEYGSFPSIDGSIYDTEHVAETILDMFSVTSTDLYGSPKDDLSILLVEIIAMAEEHGVRNATRTTIAPTGTLSTVAGLEGYGCEPAFALGYTRKVVKGDGFLELDYVSPLLQHEVSCGIEGKFITPDEGDAIIKMATEVGSIQSYDTNSEWVKGLKDTFVVSSDISWREHISVQSAFQEYIDNSISKTIIMTAESTVQDVENAYMTAWETACKGITVYVSGSRKNVVLQTKKDSRTDVVEANESPLAEIIVKTPRPSTLWGRTFKVGTPSFNSYITVNHLVDGTPFEVFLNVGKAGSDLAAMGEAIGRMLSLYLRTPSVVPGRVRLQWAIQELARIGGSTRSGFGPNQVTSLPDAVATSLSKSLVGDDPEPVRPVHGMNSVDADICPDCHATTLIRTEGCSKCTECGYSKC
jgi:ribonucleoside-diphosphate reductase alpha chain